MSKIPKVGNLIPTRRIIGGAVNYVCKPFTQEEITTKMVESLGQGMEF